VLIGRRAVVRRELSTGEADHCARNLCMLGGYRHGSRQLLSAISPILSWTVGSLSTTDCRRSVRRTEFVRLAKALAPPVKVLPAGEKTCQSVGLGRLTERAWAVDQDRDAISLVGGLLFHDKLNGSCAISIGG
jgi:hypothetical protein